MIEQATTLELGKEEFRRVRKLVYDFSGINLHEGKEALVRARLMKRVRKLKFNSFKEYLNFVESEKSGTEFLTLIDVLTTNKTHFFREKKHFDFITDEIIPKMTQGSYKWWSAGCSTGEEAITLAISYLEKLGNNSGHRLKILATDISRDVIRVAKSGIYPAERMNDVPAKVRQKYFTEGPESDQVFAISDEIRNMITYGRLNLKGKWPLKGPFHVIMCRNVMIYFDRPTQQKLVSRFHELLEPGGYLFLGHSESVSGQDHGFLNVSPAVYKKRGG